ncbi:MAG: adenylate/guanylate cyclase domain-containing protein [Pseudomonadota bacterium]
MAKLRVLHTLRVALAKYGIRWALGLALTCFASAQVLNVFPSPLANSITDRIDLLIYDMRTLLEPAKLDKRIVIVNIDEKSLAEVGRWPWSRNIVADLVDKLAVYYKSRAIAFDVVFAEPDTSSGYSTLEALAMQEFKNVPAFGERLPSLKLMLDYDGRLAAAIKGQPVVLGYYLSNEQGAIQKGLLPKPVFTTEKLNGHTVDALLWKSYSANLPLLQQAARAGGFMNPTPDTDGVIRRLPLLAQVDKRYYESLALATARVALGATTVTPVFLNAEEALMSEQDMQHYGALDAIRLENANSENIHSENVYPNNNNSAHSTTVPVERNLTALVHYRGKGGPAGARFRYVSAVDLLKGRIPQQELAHTIMLIGTTVPGLKDLRTAPLRLDYPGVEMHANMIASILDNDFKRQPDFSIGFDLLQVFGGGLVLSLLLPALTPLVALLLASASMIGLMLFNFWMYQSLHWVLPVASALVLVFSLFMINIAWGYLFEYRKRQAMVSLFGEYVAPELVAEMAAHPESYSMAGESRELTVLFADVRGFTTISEGLDPNELREYINLYLTAMSEAIRANRGTLDKYIGDAVMAFWGAPLTLPNHASYAVATSLQMHRAATLLNQDFIARGWPPLKIGIGLNTGQMRVGDMGSKIRRAYTVMGDAVNLSSRLEGITKVYGVGIVVGEATKLAAPEYAYRELDRVRVKGKNRPVPIFEPIALETELEAPMRHILEQWHEALNNIRSQRWEQAEELLKTLHSAYPEEELYSMYLGRIEVYKQTSLGDDWDGVTTFESK